jgi:hypothetical protein
MFWNYHQMNVVGHEAITKNLEARSVCVIVEQIQIHLSIRIAKENLLLLIAALSDMVRAAR